jgi:archaellum component FlaF (FlaF/FlaG flagellin family)
MTKESKKKIIVSAFACLLVALLVCIGFLIYCGIMTSYTAYTDAGTFESIPAAYKKKCDKEGKIVCLNYTTSTYYSVPTVKSAYTEEGKFDQYLTMEDVELNKEIYVYLPYGYDESDLSTKYDVLYHIHGTWCDGTTLVKGVGKDSETKNVLDNMIENGDMKPTIVVFPTWYNGLSVDEDDPDYLISHFDTEFRNDIIPLVERTYHTYAGVTASMTEEEVASAIVASREHRAVSGYSRGGTLTW